MIAALISAVPFTDGAAFMERLGLLTGVSLVFAALLQWLLAGRELEVP